MQMYGIFLAIFIIMIIIILVYIPIALIHVRKIYNNNKNIEYFNYVNHNFDESNDDSYGRLSTILEEDMEEIEKMEEGYKEIKNTNNNIFMIIETNGEVSIIF